MLKRLFKKIYIKFHGMNKYLRKKGAKVGQACHIYSDISTTETYLIEIGNNVTISSEVCFVTHDNSICKVLPDKSDIFGKIKIGDNCFIGQRSTILYGVQLAANTIVAAGSVVTKSVKDHGLIIAGNPAVVVGSTANFGNKMGGKAINLHGLNNKKKRLYIEQCKKVERKEISSDDKRKE